MREALQPRSERLIAQVAELVDAQVSGTCGRKVVEVRVFSWAPSDDTTTPVAAPGPLGVSANGNRIELHVGDLPAGLTLGLVGRHRHRDHRPASAPRPAVPGPAEGPGRHLPSRPLPAVGDPHRNAAGTPGTFDAPNLKALLEDPGVVKLFHYARFDVAMLRRWLGAAVHAGLLHQDRLAAGAHLHRPPRPEGPLPRAARRRAVEGAAELRLGRRRADPRAAQVRRQRRAVAAPPARPAGRDAAAARAAATSPPPASPSSPTAPPSTSRAGPKKTSSPTELGQRVSRTRFRRPRRR